MVIAILLISAFLAGLRFTSYEAFAPVRKRIRAWREETHSAGFELRRHFFRRFFDSELISDPDQAKVVAGGVLAILLSISVIYTQAYWHKYVGFEDDANAYRFQLSSLADFLFLITLTMTLVALLTTVQWPSLFPGLRDYLALAALPLRMRQLFVAKFTALVGFGAIAIVAIALPPSGVFTFVMHGRWSTRIPGPGVFVAAVLAGFFVFFTLLTVQGVLLNLLPVRIFERVSLALQGALLAALLCALPLVLSIPELARYMDQRPSWSVFAPPLWFLGVDQVMMGNEEPLAARLASIGVAAVAVSALAAVLSYSWSYRRHRHRVIESPGGAESASAVPAWMGDLTDRLVPNPRTLAVFGFIAKSLARSRQHRLILSAFGAIALAIVSQGFAGLLLDGAVLRHFSMHTGAFRQAVIAAPLAFSLFTLSGLRYLFRLPVELRANWVFRLYEPGHGTDLLAGAERFMLYWGALPVALLTLPAEIVVLGPLQGALASLACLFASLALMELLLFSLERIPFTSSYFPGKDPPVVTVIKYALASAIYIGVLSALIRAALPSAVPVLFLLFLLAAGWLRARTARLNVRHIARLQFEEFADPTVLLLRIERD